MKKSLAGIEPIATSHKAGMKRVLLAANESGCPITQIAITDLKAGEVAEAHTHKDMQEGFYVLSGELEIVLDSQIEHCNAEDFVFVKCGTNHELRAITDVRVLTIGCVIIDCDIKQK
jgi:mannose-6-phosphate isomerase-like protein (cupin superfamily)